MKITGAIFDLDGTILDSMHVWENLGSNYLISLGKTPEEDLLAKLEVMSLKESAKYFIDYYKIDKTVEEIIQGVNATIMDYYQNIIPMKDGVSELMEALKQKGVKISLATASERPLAEAALKRLDLLKYFDAIFTCSEVGCCKNTADIYEEALKAIGTEKETTYVFEDAYFAIKTAKEAGFKVIGIYDKFNERHVEDIKKESHKFIRSYRELL